jgi:hypothetical protein
MKTLNLKSFLAILCIAAISFAACSKKKDDVAPPAPMEGTWIGKWGFGNDAPTEYFSFIISGDGTMIVKEGSEETPNLGKGTWTLNENTFTAVYAYDIMPNATNNIAAKLNDTQTEISGSWGDGEGTFIMTKQ